MSPEKKELDRIVRHLTRLRDGGAPIYWFKVHGGPMQRAGVPDLVLCYRGVFVGLEVKSAIGEPTKLQVHNLEKIKKAGGLARVVRSVDGLIEILAEIDAALEPLPEAFLRERARWRKFDLPESA